MALARGRSGKHSVLTHTITATISSFVVSLFADQKGSRGRKKLPT